MFYLYNDILSSQYSCDCYEIYFLLAGIFKTTGQPDPAVTIDLSEVGELKQHKFEGGVLTAGASVSINRLAQLLVDVSNGAIFKTAHDHLKKVAGNTIRNVGFKYKFTRIIL